LEEELPQPAWDGEKVVRDLAGRLTSVPWLHHRTAAMAETAQALWSQISRDQNSDFRAVAEQEHLRCRRVAVQVRDWAVQAAAVESAEAMGRAADSRAKGLVQERMA
jgi:hypothetical protein